MAVSVVAVSVLLAEYETRFRLVKSRFGLMTTITESSGQL